MTDNLDARTRSKVMSSIKGRNTVPELMIRKGLWALGKSYRLHDRRLPGTPDICNFRSKVAVFIDGCFWHGCRSCYREPTSNVVFWRNKLRDNKRRRKRVKLQLQSLGFLVLEFWEHQILADPESVAAQISSHI